MKNTKLLDVTFVFSLGVTGLIGVIEIVSGFGVLFSNVAHVTSWLTQVSLSELMEYLSNPLAHYLIGVINSYSVPTTMKTLTIVWLIVHGTTNVSIAFFVFRRKYWIYPIAIFTFSLLALYQTYLYMHNPSIPMLVFMVAGLGVVSLTTLEYRKKKKLNTNEGG